MCAEEGAPGQPRPAGCRRDAAPPQRGPDRGRGDVVAQLEELAADPQVAPAWVLLGQAFDQIEDRIGQARPAGSAPPAEDGPLAPDEFAVPSKQRLGPDRE